MPKIDIEMIIAQAINQLDIPVGGTHFLIGLPSVNADTRKYIIQGVPVENADIQTGATIIDNDWIIAKIYNSEHLEPEEVCLMLVTHLEKITQFLSSNCPIEDIPLFFRVVNKGVSSSLTHSHRCKVLYTLREQNFFERQDLQEELKCFYTKETLSMSDIEFIADITDLMKLSVDLAALPLRDSLICSVMLEQVLNKLGDGMQHLKDKLTEVKEIQNQMRQSNKDSGHDGGIARFMRESEMYILPSVDIIRSKSNKELTEPHEIGTPFDSELHYLLYTFSIFREDFIRPLCNGIIRYMSFMDEESDHYFRDTDVRLFEDVHIQSKHFIKGTGIVWEIQLANMHYHPSILKFGSLLCFSHDGFSTLFYATVAHRDAESLKQGKIDVKFIDIDTQTVLALVEYTFVMLESRSFYPAYSHSLKTLKDTYNKIERKCLSLPLKPYMIGHSVETRAPKYLEMIDTVSFNCLLQYESVGTAEKYDSVCITDLKQWPMSDELGLDESQYEALQMALTKDVALIQGPPGTGKTFMGIRLAEFLLSNRHLWRESDRNLPRPLLLISYTNHALDQFLGALMKHQHYKECYHFVLCE
ncbi:NFX1-type zinc finger-containing protein 1-like [Gigantopelta aegis]|uniref:NFX1-type zinc finger-containing protein 1-like n=1 Tax=Gigantopelta aegis TaxID=1735272 RepID=UPI001B8874CA|nr:NFX1-type zinc finger-containing protein 1-like [Gigantopelta aegis]